MTTTSEDEAGTAEAVRADGKGRGVLEGAFILLDTLARYDEGAGLSALARESGLPKATAYRLVEQLVRLGAVERYGPRYVVGRVMERLGASWRPHADLRHAAREPVRLLAERAKAAAAVSVLYQGRLKAVISTPGTLGEQVYALPIRSALPAHSAAGQVLHAAASDNRPAHGSLQVGKRSGDSSWDDMLAVDQQGVLPGVCCVAAPVCLPDGRPVAAVSALTFGDVVPPGVADLVRRAGRAITRNMMLG